MAFQKWLPYLDCDFTTKNSYTHPKRIKVKYLGCVFSDRHQLRLPIRRASARVDELAHPMRLHGFQDCQSIERDVVVIPQRIRHTLAHVSDSCKVHHCIDGILCKNLVHALAVTEVAVEELQPTWLRKQRLQLLHRSYVST